MAFYAVRMGAITMNGLPDINGDCFVVTEVDGLWGSDVDLELTQVGNMGARVDLWRYKELRFTLKGTAYSTANADFDVLRILDKLNRNSFPLGLGTLYVDGASPYPAVQLDVLRAGKLHLPAPERNVQPFELDFVAPDPRKYDQVPTTVSANSNSQTLTNNGDVEAPVTATLNSGATDPWLQNDAVGRVTLPGSVPAGTVVKLGEKVTVHPIDGIRDMAAPVRTWWSMLPGANTIRTSGNWTIAFRSSWI